MKRKNELQLVEIDHRKFAVELVNGNVKVNLTEMSKLFGRSKRPQVWLKTQESKDYINALAVALKSATADLLHVKQGGKNQGTWAGDYRIAMRYAQWLSPEFSISVDEILIKLLTRNAVVAEPIAGVWPIIQNGVIGYPRKEILQASGYSYNSGNAYRLKKRYPQDNFHILRVACLSPRLATLMNERGKVRQMELQFTNHKSLA